MSTYSNRLQPPKPAIITCCSVVPPEKITRKATDADICTMHISVDVQRITLNAFCMMISGGRTEHLVIIAGFLPRHWLYE